ncbi:MAG: hypothetical protein HDT13_06615 [Butyrivibrio sp.]|nr:hypothetical protein [Butyrivibrio sp.]
MNKKILMGILTAVFIMVMGETVYAANMNADGQTAQVPVTYTVSNTSFVITIPAVIAPGAEGTSFEIGASGMNLRPEEYIEVSVSSGCAGDGTVTLKRQNVPEGKPVATLSTVFSVGGQNIGANGFLVGRFEDGADSRVNRLGAVSMSALNVDENTEAGDYMTTVEFKVKLKSR